MLGERHRVPYPAAIDDILELVDARASRHVLQLEHVPAVDGIALAEPLAPFSMPGQK